MWMKSMRLDSIPQVDIRAVKPNKKRTEEQKKAKFNDAKI
jgi:hypothetical protein